MKLAVRDGAKTLILESTFSLVVHVGKSMMSWLAVSTVSLRFDSISKIAGYAGPLIQTHGRHDDVIPFQLGIRLYETANEPKTFAITSGGHNDGPPPKYKRSLKSFITSLPAPVPAYHDKHCVQHYEPESNCRLNSKFDDFLYQSRIWKQCSYAAGTKTPSAADGELRYAKSATDFRAASVETERDCRPIHQPIHQPILHPSVRPDTVQSQSF